MYVKAQEKIAALEREKAKVESGNAQYKNEVEKVQLLKLAVWNLLAALGHQEFSADEIYSKLRRNGYRW